MNIQLEDPNEKLWTALGKAMQLATDEPILHKQLEEFFSPKPAQLAQTSEEAESLQMRVGKVAEALGGAPILIVQGHNDPKPKFDTYPNAAFNEALELFHRSRRSIVRAHVSSLGYEMNKRFHDVFLDPIPEDVLNSFLSVISGNFWEHAEIGYMRLAAYWDRVGQILDFAFFRIRQYERDGFSAVMDRIHNNWAMFDSKLRDSKSWQSLRGYQTSEKVDGLKWLLRRRNLLVHSLSLRPIEPDEIDPIFESAFNHIDAAIKRKLAPKTMQEELGFLHTHLSTATKLFTDVLSISEYASKNAFKPFSDQS